MSENNAVLDRLKAGIRKFQTEIYPGRRGEYERAAREPQKPHTLLITCADSRVDPETITQSRPGDIFVTRNVGNMVPPYGGTLGGVSSAIEYAVDVLKVKHAVVCGHADCGAMKGLLHPETLEQIPTVKHWLHNGTAALRVAETLAPAGSKDLLRTLTEQNVLMQMTHLRTHPSIAGAIARGELTISGWVYDIATGDVLIYDERGDKPTLISRGNTEMTGVSSR